MELHDHGHRENKFKMAAPKSIEGGLVTVKLRNAGKVMHDAQLVSLGGGHTAQEALKITSGDKVVLPDWLHAEGGVASTMPGQTATATGKLPPGRYAILDDASDNIKNTETGRQGQGARPGGPAPRGKREVAVGRR